jgi:hypothetical protein
LTCVHEGGRQACPQPQPSTTATATQFGSRVNLVFSPQLTSAVLAPLSLCTGALSQSRLRRCDTYFCCACAVCGGGSKRPRWSFGHRRHKSHNLTIFSPLLAYSDRYLPFTHTQAQCAIAVALWQKMNHTHSICAWGGSCTGTRGGGGAGSWGPCHARFGPGTVASPHLRCVGLVVGAVGG